MPSGTRKLTHKHYPPVLVTFPQLQQTLQQRQLILAHSFRDLRVRHHPCVEPWQQHRVTLLNHKQETEIKLAMA